MDLETRSVRHAERALVTYGIRVPLMSRPDEPDPIVQAGHRTELLTPVYCGAVNG